MPRLMVLDAMGLAYRAYYAFISRPLRNSRGENTSAIFGFANSVLKVRREERPDYWALAWDGPGPTFRHERFADYKATRKPMPVDLVSQIDPIEEIAGALGLPVIELPGVEADDVMATLARRGEQAGFEVVLVTSDKDMLQLVDEQVSLLSPVGRGEDYVRVDPAAVREKWGVSPEQTRDVLALMGDSSDNVPGVPGVGEKTAVELISRFGSLEELYLRLADVTKPALREKLAANRERAFLSRELVTVKTDCDLPVGWDDLRLAPVRRDALLTLARRFELVRLEQIAEQLGVADALAGAAPVGRAPERRVGSSPTPALGATLETPPAPNPVEATPAPSQAPVRVATPSSDRVSSADPASAAAIASPAPRATQGTLDLWSGPPGSPGSQIMAQVAATHDHKELEARLRVVLEKARDGLALLPWWEGDHPRRARVVGLAVATAEAACYLPLGHEGGDNLAIERVSEWLGPTLDDPDVPRYGEDLKRDAHLLAGLGLPVRIADPTPLLDLHLLSFLCDPERDHRLEAVARDFVGRAIVREPDTGSRRVRPSSLPVEAGASIAAAAATLFPAIAALRAQLEAREQWSLYQTLERPLVPVLYDMEREGVRVDALALGTMSSEAGAEIDRLRAELLAMAGEPVNLDSGPQVAKILFETLKLKPGGRTPGGALSTRQDVLEELADQHPFPARLLEYRALVKLRSTYYDALPAEVDPRDGRVHTVFEQGGAATGRLSSWHPNLQNIPMRTERGRRIRRAFVARDGAVLVGADYSQIELRVMAHLSGDPALVAAFESGEDIHASTARRIFQVSGALDPGLRARAKIVNFGIMYGMGARSLSQQMGIGLPEAQDFIAHYFRVFEGVRAFLDRVVEDARRQGYVQTLLGRRRYLPGLDSSHGAQRSANERAAINTPIQGSAADLMKLAMIRVHQALRRSLPSTRLLLQVHDELVLECDAGDTEAASALVKAEMEGCFPLRVPLVVGVGHGASWFDVH